MVEFDVAKMFEWAKKYYNSPEVNGVISSDVLNS